MTRAERIESAGQVDADLRRGRRIRGAILVSHALSARGWHGAVIAGSPAQYTAEPWPSGLAAALHDVAHYPQRAE